MPENISIEKLLTDDYISSPRNRQIAQLTKDLGWIEKFGSGIRRIVNYFTAEKLPKPQFCNISDGFMVTVFSDDISKVTEKVTENQAKIIQFILKKSPITSSELSSIIGISERKIKENIKKLKNLGIIKRIGPDKGGYGEVVQ